MYLNTIKPAEGSKKSAKRLGRGIGSGKGKTCGRGHKGQLSRSGKTIKAGFEGGQMPLQRRLPKFGFSSRVSRVTEELRLPELEAVKAEIVNIDTLKKAGLIGPLTKFVKVILSGEIKKAVTISTDVRVTKGARSAIEAAGGKVE